jgi:thiamine pyrophosphate-dependent acetolactate synthase large subunit-like protein
LIVQSDLIVCFGASFSKWTSREGKLIGKNTSLVQIDIDPRRLGISCLINMGVHADAKLTAAALLTTLQSRGHRKRTGWRSDAVRQKIKAGDYLNERYADQSTDRTIDPRTLSKAIDRILPYDRTLAADAGHFMGWVPRYFRVPEARASCMSFSFQSVGLGIGSAIGLALSQPDRLNVLGVGDGGFYMSLADLETAVRLRLRMCVVVYNDSAYGSEVHQFRPLGFDVDIARFPETDIAQVAQGLGAQAIVVRRIKDLAPLEDWVREGATGVFVVDAKIPADFEADWLRA